MTVDGIPPSEKKIVLVTREDVRTCFAVADEVKRLVAESCIVEIELALRVSTLACPVLSVLVCRVFAVIVEVAITTVDRLIVFKEVVKRVPSCRVPVLRLLKNSWSPDACWNVIDPVLNVVAFIVLVVIVEAVIGPL